MKIGDKVELTPMKSVKKGVLADETVQVCSFLQFDELSESIYLKLQEDELVRVSLDVIYNCKIISESEVVSCTGRIKDRYQGKIGKTIRLGIENGFYKISIN